jgi:6,7-dimethyl-8-ribityllumazine synthase
MKPNILIVEAPYYAHVAEELANGATAALEAAGATYERLEVPGALEIPVAIAMASEKRRFDGFVALGCVIRGETSHYDIVAGESARALMDLAIERGLAIGNGILTVDTGEQAMVRAEATGKNKGGDAVAACLSLISARQKFARKASE